MARCQEITDALAGAGRSGKTVTVTTMHLHYVEWNPVDVSKSIQLPLVPEEMVLTRTN